jgi:hypothetical protein
MHAATPWAFPVREVCRAALPEAMLPVVHRWFTRARCWPAGMAVEWLITGPAGCHAQRDPGGTSGRGIQAKRRARGVPLGWTIRGRRGACPRWSVNAAARLSVAPREGVERSSPALIRTAQPSPESGPERGSPGRNRTFVATPDSKSGGPCQQTNRGTTRLCGALARVVDPDGCQAIAAEAPQPTLAKVTLA